MRPVVQKLVGGVVILTTLALVVGVWTLFHGDVARMAFAAAFLALVCAGWRANNH